MDGTTPTVRAGAPSLLELLNETELLLAYATGDGRTWATGTPPSRDAIAAVIALRGAIEEGRPTAPLEPDFFLARAAIADAAKPATPHGLAAYRDGRAQSAYEELAWTGHLLFAALAVAFVAFSLLARNVGVIGFTDSGTYGTDGNRAADNSYNMRIAALAQQAGPLRQLGLCDRVAAINYEVNTLKERVLTEYNEAAMLARWMSAFTLANGPDYRVTIERYPLELVKAGNDCQPKSPPPAAQEIACDSLPDPPARMPNVDCNFYAVEQAARKAHWGYGTVVLPMLFGAYGATANSRRRALSRLRDRTLTTQLARSYWLRIGLAAFAGAFLSQVIPAQLGDKLLQQLSPFVLAFLVGYKLPDLLAWVDTRFLPAKR